MTKEQAIKKREKIIDSYLIKICKEIMDLSLIAIDENNHVAAKQAGYRLSFLDDERKVLCDAIEKIDTFKTSMAENKLALKKLIELYSVEE